MTWPKVLLSDLLELSIGGVWGKERGAEDTEVRVWRVTELKAHGRLDPSSAAYRSVPRRQYESRSLQPGDLLLEKSGGGPKTPVGRVGLVRSVPEPAVCANFMQLMRPRTDLVEPRFLHLYLNHFHQAGGTAGMQKATTNIRNIKASEYVRLHVPMPSRTEQRRIVDLLEDHLSRLDAAEHELRSAGAKQDLVWLSTLSSLRRELLDESQAPIGEIAQTSLGKMLDAKRQTGTPTRYLRNINVRWGAFELSDVQLTQLTELDVARFDVRAGDVMVCEGGEPGRCAVWRGSADIAFQKALHRIRVHGESEMLPEFVALMLTEAIRSGRSDRLFTGTTIRHLTQEKLRTIKIPTPSIQRQRDALAQAEDLTSGQARLGSAIDQALLRGSALRRSLLAAAFSGRLTGNDMDLSLAEEMIDS